MIKPLTKLHLIFLCFICLNEASAQKVKADKFGAITIADFNPVSPVVDANAEAVILSDIGSSDFEGNNLGWFTLIYKRHCKILLYKRASFDKLATVSIKLYAENSEDEEKLEDVEAATYNKEGVNIISTKLIKEDILKEKSNKYFVRKKFTFPNLKEGSIIEYSYTVKSRFFNRLRHWEFQSTYPVLYSSYTVTIPPIFTYMDQVRGSYQHFENDSIKTYFKTYSVIDPGRNAYSTSDYYLISGDVIWKWWSMKDVPAFKEEKYITTTDNYISKVEFQLSSIQTSKDHSELIIKPWIKTVEDLMKSPHFGEELSLKKTNWLKEYLPDIVGNTSGYVAAVALYKYVQNTFSCADYSANELSQTLKDTWKTKKGNVADINLLLLAALAQKGFDVTPVILSTRHNGRVRESVAILDQYNYVICQIKIAEKTYLLDATNSRLGFGKLMPYCYNGTGRLIDKMPYLISLSSDSLLEKKTTSIFMVMDIKGNADASYTSTLGDWESMNIREHFANNKRDFFQSIKKSYSFEVALENETIDSLQYYNEPLVVKYDMKFNLGQEELLYINPMMTERVNENPFPAADRINPIEMTHTISETYYLTMDIPSGYKIEEIPKSVRVKLNEADGIFEYIIQQEDGRIQLKSVLKIGRANFSADDYQTLRDFYAIVVKKQAEQIVIKKSK